MINPEYIKAKLDRGEWVWMKFPSQNRYEYGWNKQYEHPRLISLEDTKPTKDHTSSNELSKTGAIKP